MSLYVLKSLFVYSYTYKHASVSRIKFSRKLYIQNFNQANYKMVALLFLLYSVLI
jgi:hypothetical protein